MKTFSRFCTVSLLALAAAGPALAQTEIVVATVNNADMIRMQEVTSVFEEAHPEISVKWVTLEENILRQRVTTDIATGSGQYDVMTIGNYEVPIWGKQEWLVPLDNLDAEYDVDDLLPKVKASLSYEGTLYAAPFYAEASMTYYRTDLFEKAGLEMSERPDWEFIKTAAAEVHDPENGVYGICLRGKAGWGENMNFITAMANSYGARWFDEEWDPQFDTEEWKATLTDYVDLMQNAGPPGASTNGATQALAQFSSGGCGIFIDATVFASVVSDPEQSSIADKVGFAFSPDAGKGKSAVTLWSWALGIPAASRNVDAAKEFIMWATSKEYTDLIAERYGILNAPPATRQSLYDNDAYLEAAPFAQLTLEAVDAADPENPTVDPVPYVGVQFVAIPEFQAFGTSVGQSFSAAAAGTMSVDQALASAQSLTERAMRQGGYSE